MKKHKKKDIHYFVHAQNFPWKNVRNEESYCDISKESMKKWFSKYLNVNIL